jgi:hypothetical protein
VSYGDEGGGTVTVVDVVDVGAAAAATGVPTGLRISL